MEVEEVGFDGEGVDAEGGAVAHVGDGLKALSLCRVADSEGGNVDAVGGEELWVWGEVDRGDGVAGAVAASRGRGGDDGEGAAEEGAGL